MNTPKETADSLLQESLLQRLNDRTAVIGVIGLGYVGLPLSVEKAKAGYHVIGFDVQAGKIDMVNAGYNYIGDVVDEDLRLMVESGRLRATADYAFLREVDAVAICVPTPLDLYRQPDTSYVENSVREIAKELHPGMLVVLESTTYPGTTEELIRPILEATGLVCGRDFFLAYSPERVDPGNKSYNTKNTPKVVGGITPACSQIAAALYRQVLEGEVKVVSSPAVAEMEKIYENTFRHINIALANEMALLCSRMNIDVWEVIEAAGTKPYGFMAFYPGPGLGGHCIPVDPFYLTWKAKEYNYHTRLIELAGEINNAMPEFVVQRIGDVLNEHRKAVSGSTVYLLGAAYKKDIDDYRESPVLKMIELLESKGAKVIISDTHIRSIRHRQREYACEEMTPQLLASADIAVITTDHSGFDYELIAKESRILFDTRGALRSRKGLKPEAYYLL
ncbi:UDP-N-acetyl-D-glucosamine dehydrogenase [Paenibacillus sp. CAA11]|uniref:nucleotide sugar dehydrogenase n=1 Tax=Paenibacillus sp. CAA11 TaxID=1532905 RepID=UPI000D3A55D0|nr:nucleotide sugar dehydrogenase [Paenibacillus sp. CAA11]AWB46413.1 UDP-N-acetyl-D-glucosamine dehydrogenase [Paenibacillus sp. CAA11]